MASVDNIKNSIAKISERLKKSEENSVSKWKILEQKVRESLASEHSGSNEYDEMSKLALESDADANTKYSLSCIFDSMAADERKHYNSLKQVSDIMSGCRPDENNKACKQAPKVMKSHSFKIEKLNQDRQIAFGFCLFATDADGNVVVDLQGDTVTPEELESIAYNYVKNHRDVGQLHMTSGEGCVVESFVTTPDKFKAMGLDVKAPIAWWVGLYIEDPEVWSKVKSGEYRAFSIEGEAERVEVDT